MQPFHETLAAVEDGGLWGYINHEGNVVIDCQFMEADSFCEGYAAVKKDGKWGFVDSSGQIRIDLKYDEVVIDFYLYMATGGLMIYVGEFHDAMAFVSKDLYCIIDDKGEYIFQDSCFFTSSLSCDARYDTIPAYVYTDNSMKVRKYGSVGLNGEQRLKPVFDYVHGIYGDYVLVSNKMDDGKWRYGFIKIWEESDEYFHMIYDDNGQMLLDVAGKFFELEKQEQINNE